ncbi:MotA/TolQ/ExbB proton channel family protein [Prosthecobacter sp.]|uniref:MotA/TolQ/ExbB proton channel family protein n=1 Tax=Prosthecobacter sp. TaxID=1965333 RepID=UPI00378507BD
MKSATTLRLVIAISMVICSMLLLVLLHYGLDSQGYYARMLMDRNATTYPLTVQNIMWVVFFLGFGEILLRLFVSVREGRQLRLGYLSEDVNAPMLTPRNIGTVYQKTAHAASQGFFLPRLIQRITLMFQSSRATDQAHSLLNTSLDLFMHEVDIGYNMIRYLMWLIPSLGFIGTVKGIGDALDVVGLTAPTDPKLLSTVTKSLAVAFDTTLLGLIMAAVLLLAMHIIQGREEETLNKSGQYCVDNLINRLHAGQQSQS